MNLVIDIGNTRIKTGLFSNEGCEEFAIIDTLEELELVVSQHKGNCIVSNVREASIHEKLLILNKNIVILKPDLQLPIIIDYETPKTLGLDRIAVCCGAVELTNNPCLVVDIGTCITLDVVNSKREFIGGNISPGPKLRFESMHNFTSSLPLERLNETSSVLGKSTKEALQSGVKFGIIDEIMGMYQRLLSQDENYQLVLTGGYTNFFDTKLKEGIFANQNLVLIGLNRILNWNVKK